jgi:hypothetical protein
MKVELTNTAQVEAHGGIPMAPAVHPHVVDHGEMLEIVGVAKDPPEFLCLFVVLVHRLLHRICKRRLDGSAIYVTYT